MTHTPGPWTATQSVDFPDRQTVITNSKSTRIIAIIDQSDEEEKANTCLIAAAPELLEELINIANRIARMNLDYDLGEDIKSIIHGELDAANIVISKATGGQE